MMDLFGTSAESLNAGQMAVRAVVIFVAGLVLIRVAGLRTLGKMTAFDQLTLLIIGSILGRAVVTGKCFFGAIGAVLIIVLLQRLMAWVTFKSHRLGQIIKGKPISLIEYGHKNRDNMASSLVTDEDLEEALHTQLNSDNPVKVKKAILERSGHISFIENKAH